MHTYSPTVTVASNKETADFKHKFVWKILGEGDESLGEENNLEIKKLDPVAFRSERLIALLSSGRSTEFRPLLRM